ncbi:CRTAC1 family protein [Puniceibacterium sediminis]|uniref:Repeat domain-containing protein n=1 Tax=Puniceibacterium sediminis TaxID=1608407 RepID=A0A238VDF5_9RHOB|nr:CRTAC1 family protein [Puniceibacterium sediminis]SNR32450.1 Repeat domain-containing protein [Puniceibacterium sediminis]
MIRAVLLCLLATSTAADPLFEDHSDALPEHIYSGGWEHFVGGGVAVFDCNGDMRPDIFAAGGEASAILLRNIGGFTFDAVPLEEMTSVTGAYPLDMDADGWMDLYVLRVGPDKVLKGGPDCTFSDVTDDWGIPQSDQWSTAFTAWWVDDRRPQIAVGHYVDRANAEGPFGACDTNTLLIPEAKGYRADILAPGFCSLSMLAARDARGRATLRISNDRHYYVKGGYEQMWDIPLGRFLDEDDGWAKVSLWGMGIASRDLTGDGRPEVMLTSMADQLLQIAQADGTYVGAPHDIGTYATRPHVGDDGRPSTGWHAQFGDVDNDGRADLFIAKGNVDQMPGMAIHDPNNLLMQQADGTFVERAATAGVATTARSRGAALADFDGDGRLDLVVSNRRAPLELYRNVTKGTGHWLEVALTQPGGNRNAVGAQVTVNGQVQEITIGGGHAGGQAVPLHFGLGGEATAQVSVIWPDGEVSDENVQADRMISLSHP